MTKVEPLSCLTAGEGNCHPKVCLPEKDPAILVIQNQSEIYSALVSKYFTHY